MAAILCQSFGNLCTSACSGCGQLCQLPCTMCSSVCKPACEGIKKLCTSNFCIYATVTLGLNIPPIINGLINIASGVGGCKGSQWLIVNTLFCIAHIAAALYIALQSNSFNETMQTLCYDPWIAGYILVGVGSFVWLCIGMNWAMSGAMEYGNNCPGNVGQLAYNSIYCGYSFFALGCTALFVSVMISMCMGKRGSQQTGHTRDGQEANSGGNYSAFPFSKA